MARLDRLGAAKEVAQIGAVLGRELHGVYTTIDPADSTETVADGIN
jgi:hypothetical protein